MAPRRLDDVHGTVRLARGTAQVDLRGSLQGGTIALAGEGRPFDSVPSFTISRATLDTVDLGALMGQPALAGPFSMTASGGGRWGTTDRAVQLRAEVSRSRLGRLQVTGGTAEGTLEGERLTYDFALHTTGGSVAIAGAGSPLAAAPEYEVRRGSVEAIDLGQWLGRTDLATSLNARFTATVTPGTGDSLRSHIVVDLLPSTVNQARLDAGRADLSVERGALAGELRAQGADAQVMARLAGTLGQQTRVRTDGTLRVEHLARWTGDRRADGRMEGKFGLEAVADSAGLFSVGGTLTGVGGVGEVRVQQLHLALAPTPGKVVLDTLILRSNVASLDGSGRLALRGDGRETRCGSEAVPAISPRWRRSPEWTRSPSIRPASSWPWTVRPTAGGSGAAPRPGASSTATIWRSTWCCGPRARWTRPVPAVRLPIFGSRAAPSARSRSSRRPSRDATTPSSRFRARRRSATAT